MKVLYKTKPNSEFKTVGDRISIVADKIATSETELKICSICGHEKPIGEFKLAVHNQYSNGEIKHSYIYPDSRCDGCRKKYFRDLKRKRRKKEKPPKQKLLQGDAFVFCDDINKWH